MNLKKTQCMLIGTKQRFVKCRKICNEINNVGLETVDVAKFLGVNIDCSLSWSYHIDVLTKTISMELGVLRRLKSFMSSFALLKVDSSVIFPHFKYCCTTWSGAKNAANIEKIFKLQKRAARIILNEQNVMTSSIVLFNKLKWMPMPYYFVYRKAVLVFKSLNQLVPEYLNIFKYVHQVSSRSTRQSSQNLLYVPKYKTEYY